MQSLRVAEPQYALRPWPPIQKPPIGAAAGAVPLAVESDRDVAQGSALTPQAPNLGQRSLLRGVRLQMSAVCG